MDKKLTEKIREFVEGECMKPTSKYGYEPYEFHFIPVVRYSVVLARELGADEEVVELAGWLHDIGSIIYGREEHHITSQEIAERKLREFGYPEDRIRKVCYCIASHRGSQGIPRESTEAQILADADSMAHFDDVGGLFKAAFVFEGKTQKDGTFSVLNKLKNSYQKLSPPARKIVQSKFEAAMLLFGGGEENDG